MNDKTKAAAQPEPLFQVTLLKAGLNHNGRDRNRGDVIHVSADQLAFLLKREFITAEAANQAKPAKAKE